MEGDVTTWQDHVAIMRRRWRIPVACAILGVLAGLGLSALQDPVYSASASLLLEPEEASTGPVVMDDGEVATQAQVVASTPVAERVISAMDLEETPDQLLSTVTVEVLDETRTVEVTSRRPDATEAADIANAFAAEYIEHQTAAADNAAAELRESLATRLGSVDAELRKLRAELLAPGLTEGRRRVLETREQSLLAVGAEIRAELALARAGASEGTVGGQVLRRAQLPESAAQPQPVRAAGFGGLVGLVVGVLLAYVRDRVDDGIRDEQRLRSATGGRPVLGRLPRERRPGSRLVTLTAPQSPESEGYRALTTNLRFLLSSRGPVAGGELLLICSAESGEGKTTTAANVAVTAARVGWRVILVDADFRNPGIASRFGIEAPLGLSHVLADQAELEKVVLDGAELDLPGLGIVGAGPVPPNPAELLAGPRAAAAWRDLRQLADLVIVDSAPVLGVADALEIVGQADLTVLVARHRVSRVHHVEAAVERIQQVGGSVAGVVWCDVPEGEALYGYRVEPT